jgi:membrane protease YdiL (CAAX protease family)
MKRHNAAGPRRFTMLAISFELLLGLLALLLGWLTREDPTRTLTAPEGIGRSAALLLGIAIAVPLFCAVVLIERKPWGILRNLQRIVRRQIVPLFRGVGLWNLLLISLAAGVGEELLFRGYVQAAVARAIAYPWGWCVAIVTASLLFGVCHWLCLAYAVLATAMGIVLGTLFALTGNLLAPIAAHSLYDFLALLYLVYDNQPPASPATTPESAEEEPPE